MHGRRGRGRCLARATKSANTPTIQDAKNIDSDNTGKLPQGKGRDARHAYYPCMREATNETAADVFPLPHLPVATAVADSSASTRPIGNNFGYIKLVGPNWRLLFASSLTRGKTFPGGHLKEERKRRGEARRRIQSLLSPHLYGTVGNHHGPLTGG